MKKITIILLILILLAGAGFAYWYFFFNGPGANVIPEPTDIPPGGFNPYVRPNNGNGGQNNTVPTPTNTPDTSTIKPVSIEKIPALRLLSNSPIGGYGVSTTPNIASTTKTIGVKGTTVVRWVDRGRGNIYEAKGDSIEIKTISNTVLPKIYESVWNKDLTAFIGSMFSDGTNLPTVIYARLKSVATTTSTSTDTRSPYELKGKNLPDKMTAYAVSPKGDKIFMLVNESGIGVGYIANFDGTSVVKIFNTPLIQLNVEWPEDNTISITTKGSANQSGFMYFINPKTGLWKKMLGPINGLSTKTSHDAKYILYSYTNNKQGIATNIYDTVKNISSETTIQTLADKCAWGNFYKEIVYCAVPSQIISAAYPDDWYIGNISFVDKIWQTNAKTNEVNLISSIVDQSDRVIDAFNLGLDSRDDFLLLMNKNDLSLWSFDLIRTN